MLFFMAYYSNPGDDAPSMPDKGMADDAPDKMSDDEKGSEGETALLPKTILAGKEFKPGDEVVLKIVAMHGDEVEVAYATEEGGEDDGMDEHDKATTGRLSAMADKM